MKLAGRPTRTIWPAADASAVYTFDQRVLPHEVQVMCITSLGEAAEAIARMAVRGAPLIGVCAAFGLALQAHADPTDDALALGARQLKATRPTGANLAWAVDAALEHLLAQPPSRRAEAAWRHAVALADADVACNAEIGRHGLDLLRPLLRPDKRLNLLTHCNAGWLATVDWGTALSPVFLAQREGIDLHVWVDETRPRNQGASLTAFELREQGIPHTVIVDSAAGHLMQHGQVDAVIVGCDRVTARGDVANKIGTYLKALAAHDNGVPFYVAMPLSTLDRGLDDGLAEIEIENRAAREVTHLQGRAADGRLLEVQLVPEGTAAANPAFDVTPARLVTALITERGSVAAERSAIAALAARGGDGR